jgi:hypothetical protein
MTYEIVYEEEQIQEVEKEFNKRVKSSLKKSIEEKNNQIEHKQTDESLKQRFHRDINCGHFTALEMEFKAASNNFRAIILLFDNYETLPYYACLGKNVSGQDEFIQLLKDNSEKIYLSFT